MKAERKKYSMRYRDKRIGIFPAVLRRWKLALEHGDKKKLSKHTDLSYSAIQTIFREKRATAKQIMAIESYFEKHAEKN